MVTKFNKTYAKKPTKKSTRNLFAMKQRFITLECFMNQNALTFN